LNRSRRFGHEKKRVRVAKYNYNCGVCCWGEEMSLGWGSPAAHSRRESRAMGRFTQPGANQINKPKAASTATYKNNNNKAPKTKQRRGSVTREGQMAECPSLAIPSTRAIVSLAIIYVY